MEVLLGKREEIQRQKICNRSPGWTEQSDMKMIYQVSNRYKGTTEMNWYSRKPSKNVTEWFQRQGVRDGQNG